MAHAIISAVVIGVFLVIAAGIFAREGERRLIMSLTFYILVSLSISITTIYIVVHFIIKYW